MRTAENGKRIAGRSLVHCKRCEVGGLAWTKGKSGKWYLCTTFSSQSEFPDLWIMATWNPHRCEER